MYKRANSNEESIKDKKTVREGTRGIDAKVKKKAPQRVLNYIKMM